MSELGVIFFFNGRYIFLAKTIILFYCVVVGYFFVILSFNVRKL